MFRSSTCWLVGMNTRHWSGIKTQIPATPSAALEHTLVGTLWAAALAHTASTRAAFWATGTVCARESICHFVHSPLRCCPVCTVLVPGALMNSRIYYIENSRKLLGTGLILIASHLPEGCQKEAAPCLGSHGHAEPSLPFRRRKGIGLQFWTTAQRNSGRQHTVQRNKHAQQWLSQNN